MGQGGVDGELVVYADDGSSNYWFCEGCQGPCKLTGIQCVPQEPSDQGTHF